MGTLAIAMPSVNSVAMLALAKSLAKSTADVVLTPGVHQVDETITLHVHGFINRLADQEFSPPVAVDMNDVLAFALERAGLDRRDAKRAVEAAVADVLEGKKVKNSDRTRDIEDAIEDAKEQLKASQPKKIRAGATKVEVEVEVWESEAAQVA